LEALAISELADEASREMRTWQSNSASPNPSMTPNAGVDVSPTINMPVLTAAQAESMGNALLTTLNKVITNGKRDHSEGMPVLSPSQKMFNNSAAAGDQPSFSGDHAARKMSFAGASQVSPSATAHVTSSNSAISLEALGLSPCPSPMSFNQRRMTPLVGNEKARVFHNNVNTVVQKIMQAHVGPSRLSFDVIRAALIKDHPTQVNAINEIVERTKQMITKQRSSFGGFPSSMSTI
jgi:hypothetical protein